MRYRKSCFDLLLLVSEGATGQTKYPPAQSPSGLRRVWGCLTGVKRELETQDQDCCLVLNTSPVPAR